jgi:hypothetical protein
LFLSATLRRINEEWMYTFVFVAGGEWLASCPSHITPLDRVGPRRTDLGNIERRETLPQPELKPLSCPTHSQSFYCFEILALNVMTKHHDMKVDGSRGIVSLFHSFGEQASHIKMSAVN